MSLRVRAALCALGCALMQPVAAAEEIGLCLGEDKQQRLRNEMQQLLGALHGVHAGLGERDFEAVAERAAAAGVAMKGQLEHSPDGHHAGLPHEFLKLGRATHAAFDDLSTLAREGGKPRELLPSLAKVSANCVACHDRYRLAPADDCATDDATAP